MPPSCGKQEFNGLSWLQSLPVITSAYFPLQDEHPHKHLPLIVPLGPFYRNRSNFFFFLFLLRPLSLYCCCTLILISNYDHKVCG